MQNLIEPSVHPAITSADCGAVHPSMAAQHITSEAMNVSEC